MAQPSRARLPTGRPVRLALLFLVLLATWTAAESYHLSAGLRLSGSQTVLLSWIGAVVIAMVVILRFRTQLCRPYETDAKRLDAARRIRKAILFTGPLPIAAAAVHQTRLFPLVFLGIMNTTYGGPVDHRAPCLRSPVRQRRGGNSGGRACPARVH